MRITSPPNTHTHTPKLTHTSEVYLADLFPPKYVNFLVKYPIFSTTSKSACLIKNLFEERIWNYSF